MVLTVSRRLDYLSKNEPFGENVEGLFHFWL
jgi:hypothetical protein